MFDSVHTGLWIAFGMVVLVLMAIDLGVADRHAHRLGMREALRWSLLWVSLALLFNAGVYIFLGGEKAAEFFTGYLVEESLSVDNLFVFLVLFRYFAVAPEYQHRVLFWGVIGAIVLRGSMIVAGTALVVHFHWVLYLFGAFLVFTGLKLGVSKGEGVEPEKNLAVRIARRLIPLARGSYGQRLWAREPNAKGKPRWVATTLLVVLVTIEFSDVMFAMDSVPAVLGITQDVFIVLTSNIFAILGLRALFFVLSGFMDRFHYLKIGLAVVLSFIGVKMLIGEWVQIPTWLSLCVVAFILTLAVLFSLRRTRRLALTGTSGPA